jgi:ATP-dependent DNA helicase DinG
MEYTRKETVRNVERNIEAFFPFNNFRPYQKKILKEVKESFDNGNDIAIIEGPTGFGKSPVNIALGKYYAPAFYTTPQRKLVSQIAKDFGPSKLAIDGGYGKIMSLLGRKNYICRASNRRSDKCPIRDDKDDKCSDNSKCTYWIQKMGVMECDVAVLTFAMLIVNNYLSGDSRFEKRNVMIIDECHSLESQVASMFAGFSVSPYSYPKPLRRKMWEETEKILPNTKEVQDYIEFLNQVDSLCSQNIPLCMKSNEADKLKDLRIKIGYMLKEYMEGREWVVNIKKNKYVFSGTSRQFKPIWIDRFLQRMVWSQADKIILSSATIPFRNNIKKWLMRIGLGRKRFSLHKVPMLFPIENRPIILETIGGKMTRGEEEKSWEKNIETVRFILHMHRYERGVIHTHSYDRAKKLYDSLNDPHNIFLHNKQEIDGDVIEEWLKSDKRVLLSPAITEGVDLKDDLCRFQILLKIPYPNVSDSRVKFLLEKKNQWKWYRDITARTVIQMYGRAVRSRQDYAKFYVIDGSFTDLTKRVKFPEYFTKAIKKNGGI